MWGLHRLMGLCEGSIDEEVAGITWGLLIPKRYRGDQIFYKGVCRMRNRRDLGSAGI